MRLIALAEYHLLYLAKQGGILIRPACSVGDKVIFGCAFPLTHVVNFVGESTALQFFFEHRARP
jgi:hypothetical protein